MSTGQKEKKNRINSHMSSVAQKSPLSTSKFSKKLLPVGINPGPLGLYSYALLTELNMKLKQYLMQCQCSSQLELLVDLMRNLF